MILPLPFQSALSECAQLLAQTRDPWWIIGSCAVALHGVDPGPIGDIDVLLSPRDAEILARQLDLVNQAGDNHEKFRSDILLRHSADAVDIEFMAGFRVHQAGVWHAIQPTTRFKIRIPSGYLFIPDRKELSSILSLFGRRKDLGWAAKLNHVGSI